jgi:hypothetical protein
MRKIYAGIFVLLLAQSAHANFCDSMGADPFPMQLVCNRVDGQFISGDYGIIAAEAASWPSSDSWYGMVSTGWGQALANVYCGGSPAGGLGSACGAMAAAGFVYVPPAPAHSVIAGAVSFSDTTMDVVYVGFALLGLALLLLGFSAVRSLTASRNFGGIVGARIERAGKYASRKYASWAA